MPGKIHNSAQLSKASLLAIQAERKEGVKTSSFWNKWSNLSTGQKWGRALAWIIPPLGVGIQAGANLWQARQAKIASARPEETKVTKSAESLNGTPLRSHIVFGREHRLVAEGVLQPCPDEPLVCAGDGYPSELQGLAIQYAKDLNRGVDHALISSNGQSVSCNKNSENKNTALREFFIQEFPANPEKAEKWAVFASKFLNQSAAAPNLVVAAAVGGFFVSRDDFVCKLSMEKDGNSALLEVRANGTPNKSPGIDEGKSTVDNFLLAKITLGPEEKLEVISGYSKHNLVPENPDKNAQAGVENPDPVQGVKNEPIDNLSAADILRQFARGAVNPGSDSDFKLGQYRTQLSNQEPPDFSPFVGAYSQLQTPENKQKLVGELAGVIKDKEQGQYMELAREGDEVAPAQRRQMLSDIRLNEDYPLSTRNAINPEKGPVVENARDLDIQNFVHRKFEEEIAQKHLGIPPEEFYQIIKEGMGAEGILTTGYLNKKNLPPVLENLRSNLQQDFQGATTLDDFYQRAENTIATARQNAPELGQNREIQEAQPTVVRGAVTALVLNSTSTSPAEMKSLAADLKKSKAPDLSFQINVLKDHTPVIEKWAAGTIDSATDPEALRNEREFYTKDTGRTARTFYIEKDDGGSVEIPFPVGVNKQRAANLEQNLETALQSHTSFKKKDEFLNLTQGFLHQGAFAAIFSKTSGTTGLTMSDFIRSADQPSFQVTLHRNGKIHIEGRMDTNPSAIDQDSSYLELDAKQSSLSQSFQITLTPTTVDGQTKVDCELREAEVKGPLHRANLNGANQ